MFSAVMIGVASVSAGTAIALLLRENKALKKAKIQLELQLPPIRTEDMEPPARKTFVDAQNKLLVEDVLHWIQADPDHWSEWGHYKEEGFGGSITEIEYKHQGSRRSVAIDREGNLLFRNCMNGKDNGKKAVWERLPICKYDQTKIQEAYNWLIAEKMRNVFKKQAAEKTKKES